MDYWLAFLLGMVQGLTEFFPISSSGHLMLLETFFGIEEPLFFNVVCHLGTLASLLTVFYRDLRSLNRQTIFWVIAATLPLFPCALLFKEIRTLLTHVELLPYFFAITALLLFLADRTGVQKPITLKSSLFVGLFQTVALLPGISRSGATIACGRFLGWKKEEAIRFSFLMAIPAILGAVTLETYKTIHEGISIPFASALIGFMSSYFFGVGALLVLTESGAKTSFKLFACYCLCISTLSYIFMIR
jgi:undecaprenyl-diphosphatase